MYFLRVSKSEGQPWRCMLCHTNEHRTMILARSANHNRLNDLMNRLRGQTERAVWAGGKPA